jgi:hypothetical protein
LFSALAGEQHRTLGQIQIVDGQADRFRDPGAGAVQQFQQRAIPDGERGFVQTGGVEQPFDLVHADGLRESPRRRWRMDAVRDVGRQQPRTANRCSPRTATTAARGPMNADKR